MTIRWFFRPLRCQTWRNYELITRPWSLWKHSHTPVCDTIWVNKHMSYTTLNNRVLYNWCSNVFRQTSGKRRDVIYFTLDHTDLLLDCHISPSTFYNSAPFINRVVHIIFYILIRKSLIWKPFGRNYFVLPFRKKNWIHITDHILLPELRI